MNKKILSIFVLVLTLLFSTQAFASLTFTSDAITGTTASSIDLGAGTLSLQNVGNSPIIIGNGTITTGTGLVTLGGGLSVTGDATFTGFVNSTKISSGASRESVYLFGYNGNESETTGYYNIGIGEFALRYVTSGRNNVAVGANALGSTLLSRSNTAIGRGALEAYIGAAVDERNTAIGSGAGGTNLTGIQNTYLGASTSTSTAFSNSTVAGYGATASASNQVVLGNASVTNILMGSTSGATVNAGKYKLSALNTAPATSSEACTAGEIRYTATYIYLCSAINTWVRSAFSSF